jgi:hypothetical protein
MTPTKGNIMPTKLKTFVKNHSTDIIVASGTVAIVAITAISAKAIDDKYQTYLDGLTETFNDASEAFKASQFTELAG